MKLEIHPQAEENFNKKAEDLKLKLKFQPTKPEEKPPIGENQSHVVFEFNESNIIGDIDLHQKDNYGQIVSRSFGVNGRIIGLYGEDYAELVSIAEGLEKSVNPKNKVSFDFISERIFEWVKYKYQGLEIPQLVEFILSESEKQIEENEIWIPISELHIAFPFKIGNVVFRAITKQMMNEYEETKLSDLPDLEDKTKFQVFFDRKRTKFQGLCVGTIKIEAEPIKAYQIALEEVEKSTNVLRIFAPHNMLPMMICYSAPYGQQEISSFHYFTVKDKKIVREDSGLADDNLRQWYITKDDFDFYVMAGLDVLNYLLTKPKLTDFQQKVLEAVSLYSKGALAKELSNKIVNKLVALETIFLRDSSEYIQDNISLRMAYMHPVSVEERRKIISNVKEVYKLRSSFIHHGQKISTKDATILETFMYNSWCSLLEAARFSATEISLNDFFEQLENRKISG